MRLVLLNEALSDLKHKGKSTYNTWVSYFIEGPGTEKEAVVSGPSSCHGTSCQVGLRMASINAFFHLLSDWRKGRRSLLRLFFLVLFLSPGRVCSESDQVDWAIYSGLVRAHHVSSIVPLGEAQEL